MSATLSVVAAWPEVAMVPVPVWSGAVPSGSVFDSRILVVDDDPAIRGMVSDVLDFEGYPVEAVADGEEALQAILRVRPGLVLLDMRMPVLDGWGVAAELRRLGVRVPVVVMTAAQDAYRWAREIGADAYLAKPFDLPELLSVVHRHLEPPA